MGKRKTRGNGEGSICKRKDGSWQGQVSVGKDENGKPKRVTYYGKTRKEVQDKVTATLAKIQTSTYILPSNMTLGVWLDRWIENYMKDSLKATTWESYKIQINSHIKPALGNIQLSKLQTWDLQRLISQKQSEGRCDGKVGGLSNKSIRYIHTVIHSALQQAVRERLIPYNPADVVKLPRKIQQEIQLLDDDSIRLFLMEAKKVKRFITDKEEARDIRNYLAYCLTLHTGLRRGELLGLRWNDVDLTKQVIRVKQQVLRTKEGLIFDVPKSSRSVRTIPVSGGIVGELKRYKTLQNEEKLLAGRLYNKKNDLVFCSEIGTPKDPRSSTRHFENVLKSANLEKVHFHSLRHTFAVNCLRQGVDIKTLSEMLGHHSAAFTLEVYCHVLDEMKVDAAEKIGSFLKSCVNEKNGSFTNVMEP